jgi:beta-mannosidase
MANTLDLAGVWRLRCDARNIEVDYPVPGDVHSALIAAGQIPHPYKGTDEFAVRWVADEEWVATTSFYVEKIENGYYYLDIDYLDTVATVNVNGKSVLEAENCFKHYRPNVSAHIRKGENTVEIILHSNTKAANARQEQQPFYIPYSVSNNPIPNGNMLRKPQCHFGWDWNLAIVPFGVCGKFNLVREESGDVKINSIHQTHNADGSVELEVVYSFVGLEGEWAPKPLSISFAGETRHYDKVDGQFASDYFRVETPKLWWPAGQGEQYLYELKFVCDGQIERRQIGLRKIELVTDKDATGSRFAFKVNGREIFCKGANWIPADALPSAASPELTRKLLQSAKDAHMNMIRVWGGGYYEKDWFYDICDELGLLVWQDFMFSCSLYPSTSEFLKLVQEEAEYQLERLHHHACIALWCGDNELLGALTWFEESRKNRDRYLVSYDRLNRTLEDVVNKSNDKAMRSPESQSAIWWPSSPSPGVLDFGDTWHDDSKGDMHFWSVWHEGKDFEHYYDVRPRFCSEFGFQSFPSLRLIKEFSTSEEDLNISSAVMEHHQRNKGGNARIAETMFRNFRFPMDFGNFVYLSQIQHGLAMRMAVEYWRSLKPHCMGTLYWQLNDTWPVASWSGLDHGGSWKSLHYMARRFYAPVLVTARKAGDELIVSAVHDLPQVFELSLEVSVVNFSGVTTVLYSDKVKLSPDAGQELTRVNLNTISNESILFLNWTDELGRPQRNHVAGQPYKYLLLPNPGLKTVATLNDGAVNIAITAKAIALYVSAECDVAGHFSDNAFDLLLGESRVITFKPDNPADLARAKDTLLIRDLYSSSH